jgi:hypothetical protein
MKIMKFSDIQKYNFITPDCQRIMDQSRINLMFESIRRDTNNFQNQYHPFGCITLSETTSDKNIFVLDGQHRLMVFQKIYDESKMDISFFCQYLIIDNETHNDLLFTKINDSLPLSILPQGVKRLPISSVIFAMKELYPRFFSASKTKRRPFIHSDIIEEHLAQVLKLIGRDTITKDDFIESLTTYNNMIRLRNRHFFTTFGRDVDKFYKKCEDMGGLFVGLITDYSWVYSMFGIDKPNDEDDDNDDNQPPLNNVAYRNVIYERDNKKCRLCKRPVAKEEFHMGHIISKHNGGHNKLDNICLLCPSCNTSIGKLDIPYFCNKYNIEWS